MKTIIAFFIFLSIGFNIVAQNTVIDTIQVSAERIPTSFAETSKSVSVITAIEIVNLPAQSIDELLGYIQGVNLNTRNRFGVQSDIGIRGSNFSQVLVILDNVRINDPLTGHFNNNIPISKYEIDRIEIIRGPSAAAYGSDAVGGVIHIKTKAFTRNFTDKSNNKLELVAEIEGGQNDYRNFDAGFLKQWDKFSLSGSINNKSADGEERRNPNFDLGNSSDSLYNTFFDIETYSLGLNFDAGKNTKFYVRGAYDVRDFNAKYFYTRSAFDESVEEVTTTWLNGAVFHDIGNHKFELDLGYKITNDSFLFNPAFAANIHTTNSLFANLSDYINVNNRLKLAFGAQLLNKDIESTDRGDHNNLNVGVYGSAFYFLTDNIKSEVSLRVENDDNFGTQVLPQFGLAYLNGNGKLKLNVGRSIRAGDFTERYISSLIPDLTPGRNIGNPDLQEETAWSFDLGYEWNSDSKRFQSAIFYRNSSNLIDFTLTNSNEINNTNNLLENEDYFYATNVSQSQLIGFEAAWNQRVRINGFTNWDYTLNYTYLRTTADGESVSKFLANHPTHQVNFLSTFKLNAITFVSSVNFQNRTEEFADNILGEVKSGYATVNGRLSYSFFKRFQLFVQAQNVFDAEYQEILGAPLPGRWVSFGAVYRRK